MTPTLLQQYLQCPARAGFAHDPRTQHLKRTGLRAALGIVAHAVEELRNTAIPFDEAWEREAQRIYDDLREEWAPALPPSPPNWPGAALSRARAARQWTETTGVAMAGPGSAPASSATSGHSRLPSRAPLGPLPWRERWLRIPKLDLAGKLDLVDRMDGDLRVIDLKTGLHQGEASEFQRIQLLFYCRLVQQELGTLPDVAAVQNASGDLFPIDISPDAVAAVEALATQALAHLRAPSPTGLEARPSEETCGTCPFRPVCGPFLEAYSPEWRSIPVRLGVVTAVTNDREQVDVSVVAPAWAPETMRLIGFPFPPTIAAGQVWGFSDFEGQSRTGIARWNTLLFEWTQGS